MKKEKYYYLGLDIGTDSVGYAVSDEDYNLLRFHGEDAWGTHIFDAGSLNDQRRMYRTARRRLDRRQQRVKLLQELFAKEIAHKDERFFVRLQGSYLYRDECGDRYPIFNDSDYTDADYYKQYPTIHHLIVDLMYSSEPHDVRLVYLACSWLVSHRGHFLSNIDRNNINSLKEFKSTYNAFLSYFSLNGFRNPWEPVKEVEELGDILKEKTTITSKNKKLKEFLLGGKKAEKVPGHEEGDFPFSQEGIIALLSGGKYSLQNFFGKDEYENIEPKSISLGMEEEKFAALMADLGEDYEIIGLLRQLYDWAVLVDSLDGENSISEAKVKRYNQHKEDLAFLKYCFKKYLPDHYDECFRRIEGGKEKKDKEGAKKVVKDNYPAYVMHSDESNASALNVNF
ncbi:MAG: hypothetical protein IJU20_08765 [Clostridia bacterium]|nr:hypothetical protein [Clostridia bacterium]